MVGASARYSCLHTPVETGTPPCDVANYISLAPISFGNQLSSIPLLHLVSHHSFLLFQFAVRIDSRLKSYAAIFGAVAIERFTVANEKFRIPCGGEAAGEW